MHKRAILAASLLTVMVTACGSSEQPEVVEQIVVREPGQAAAEPKTAPEAGSVDLVAMGEDAFQMCTGCHVVEAGAPSTSGPNLHGVVGRVVGSVEGYPYSEALAASQTTWDESSLDAYLSDPGGFMPGTDMLAGAVPDDQQRAAIIAYLAANGE